MNIIDKNIPSRNIGILLGDNFMVLILSISLAFLKSNSFIIVTRYVKEITSFVATISIVKN